MGHTYVLIPGVETSEFTGVQVETRRVCRRGTWHSNAIAIEHLISANGGWA